MTALGLAGWAVAIGIAVFVVCFILVCVKQTIISLRKKDR